jgi:LCP family protein required for cell wall assembly
VSELGQTVPTGQFGPLARGGRVREGGAASLDWRRVGTVLTAVFLVAMLTSSVTVGALLWYGERSIGRIDIGDSGQAGAAGDGMEELDDVLNVLLVGNDSRDGLSEEDLQALGTEEADGSRTDSIMLLQLDPRRDQAALLSFPRDLLVTRCDGSRGRINAAYGIGEADRDGGGPACLLETVTDLTDITVDHYVEVNFAGFIDVVDTLGGITIYFEEPLRDRPAGLDVPAGCVDLDGQQALGFVRARQELDNDFGRIARQQRFIREIVQELTSAGTLVNVPRLFSLVDAVGRAVDTDRDLSLGEMRRIAFSLRNASAESLDTRTVPATPRQINGAAFVVPDDDEAEALFASFREGDAAPEELGTSPPTAVTAEDVPPLTVLNGAGVTGLAREAAQVLEDAGMSVAETDNAEGFGVSATEVRYADGHLEEAEVVAAALGGVGVEESDEVDDVTVVLGDDFDPETIESDREVADGDDEDDDIDPAEVDGLPEEEAATFAGAAEADVDC